VSLKLGLISCTKSKVTYPCKARELYSPSALFTKALSYAERNYDLNGILSAKYGFILLDEPVEPYELTLKTMGEQEKKKWANGVIRQLNEKIDLANFDSVFFHAGLEYRKNLVSFFRMRGMQIHVPLEGLSFGQQLEWYNRNLRVRGGIRTLF